MATLVNVAIQKQQAVQWSGRQACKSLFKTLLRQRRLELLATVTFPFIPVPKISFPIPFLFTSERLIYSHSLGILRDPWNPLLGSRSFPGHVPRTDTPGKVAPGGVVVGSYVQEQLQKGADVRGSFVLGHVSGESD